MENNNSRVYGRWPATGDVEIMRCKVMGSDPIPIYAKSNQGKSGYAIYLDMVSKQAYRAHHKEFSQSKYWIGFLDYYSLRVA